VFALFFPEQGQLATRARAICSACRVRVDCLEYALANGERFGVWGGLSENERRSIRIARRAS
jgi:WhiB family redox-sensing transcriptional regulator